MKRTLIRNADLQDVKKLYREKFDDDLFWVEFSSKYTMIYPRHKVTKLLFKNNIFLVEDSQEFSRGFSQGHCNKQEPRRSTDVKSA